MILKFTRMYSPAVMSLAAIALSVSLPLAAVAQDSLPATPVAGSSSPSAGTRIGYVSNERIIREAAPAKAAEAKINAEFSKREKDIGDMAARLKGLSDKFDRDAPNMSEADRTKRQRELADGDREFQRRQREFREDLNQRRNEELTAVIDRANKAIRQVAESEGYDIIVQDGVYVNRRLDITDKVLKLLEK